MSYIIHLSFFGENIDILLSYTTLCWFIRLYNTSLYLIHLIAESLYYSLISSYFSLGPGHNFLLSVSGLFFKIPHIMKSKFSIFLSPPGLFHIYVFIYVSKVAEFSSFTWLNNIVFIMNIYHTLFIHSSLTLRLFPYLDYVNNTAMNMRVQMSLQYPVLIPFGYIHKSRIAGSYGSSIFNFLKHLPAIFHSGCTILHSPKLCTKIPFSLQPASTCYL